MMIDWNEYHKALGARIGELAKLSPDTVRGYQTLSAANSKTGKLDEKNSAAHFAGSGRHHALRRLHRRPFRRCFESRSNQRGDIGSPRRGRGNERRGCSSLLDTRFGCSRCKDGASARRVIRTRRKSIEALFLFLCLRSFRRLRPDNVSGPRPARLRGAFRGNDVLREVHRECVHGRCF